MSDYKVPVSITVHRPRANVIEYTLTWHNPVGGDESRTYHANREATFFGPYTGNPERQVSGGAHTLWRQEDDDLAFAFRLQYGKKNIRKFTIT